MKEMKWYCKGECDGHIGYDFPPLQLCEKIPRRYIKRNTHFLGVHKNKYFPFYVNDHGYIVVITNTLRTFQKAVRFHLRKMRKMKRWDFLCYREITGNQQYEPKRC